MSLADFKWQGYDNGWRDFNCLSEAERHVARDLASIKGFFVERCEFNFFGSYVDVRMKVTEVT